MFLSVMWEICQKGARTWVLLPRAAIHHILMVTLHTDRNISSLSSFLSPSSLVLYAPLLSETYQLDLEYCFLQDVNICEAPPPSSLNHNHIEMGRKCVKKEKAGCKGWVTTAFLFILTPNTAGTSLTLSE